MHYEIQCLIQSANGNHSRDELLVEAGKELENKLRSAGLGFIIEVRELRTGKRLFRSIDAKNL